jgi:hypothetical protein
MAKKKAKVEEPTQETPAPEQTQKPRTIIVSATEGEVLTSRVKTTRELYMEIVNAEKS